MAILSAMAIKPHTVIAVKKELTKLLETGKTYVANFYFNDPTSEVSDSEDILIIDAEYGAIGGVLSAAVKDFKNFSFGEDDPEEYMFSKWTVISRNTEETSESDSPSAL